MRGLSPALQQLVDEGRSAVRPTIADSERVLKAIHARLGLAVGATGGAPVAMALEDVAETLALRAMAKLTVGVAIAVAGFALMHWLASRTVTYRDASSWATTATSAAASSDAIAATEPSQEHTLDQLESGVVPAESQIAPVATPVASRGSTRVHDRLSEEVELLLRAEKELHGGRPERALLLLSEHERKFKSGLLGEERTAARVQALCALGRVGEARTLFAKLSLQSLHGEPTRQACAAARNVSSGR